MQPTLPRRRVLFAAVALLAIAPLMVQAAPGLHGHAAGHGAGEDARMLEHIMDRLELTEDQIQQVHGLVEPHQASFEVMHEQMVAARDTMVNAIHAETLDETAIRDAAAAKGEIDAELGVARATLLQEIRSVLTADQLAEMNEMFAEMKAYQGLHRRHQAHGEGGR